MTSGPYGKKRRLRILTGGKQYTLCFGSWMDLGTIVNLRSQAMLTKGKVKLIIFLEFITVLYIRKS
jgi:hypothetical protein